MSLIKLIDFQPLGDERGSLVALEAGKNVPFEIKRVYYIYDTQAGVARGFHAHKALKQVAVCVSGSCRFLLDDGVNKEEVVLNSPTQGLLIEHMVWREMYDFSGGCVLMVLASEHYDEADYIRDYKEFIKQKVNLVRYDENFLEKSWLWLNDEEIKKLTMTPSFTREEQKKFFETLSSRSGYIIFGVELAGVKIGACGLKVERTGKQAELWLYIGEKSFWGKGVGKCILAALEENALSRGLEKLFLKVSKTNEAAKKLYLKFGYEKYSEDESLVWMRKDIKK